MEAKKAHVLFVDDDEESSRALIRSLERHGADFIASQAASREQALKFVQDNKPQAAVVDLALDPTVGPDSGLTLISETLLLEPSTRVLVLTGHGSTEYGIKALQMGAASFLTKPAEPAHLLALLNDAVLFSQLQRQYRKLCTESANLKNVTGLSSRSPQMQQVIESAAYTATNNQPVLLIGETGVGKGVIAHAIHQAGSLSGPFIRFQPTFGSADLVASELFGHVKGAFTGATESRAGLIEEANNGSLFLDEVDELPYETQITLLNVLQEKSFRRIGATKSLSSNFRLIAATNHSLEYITEKKKLREDFFHRIAHLTIDIPPLRELPEDIPMLAEKFSRNIANQENLQVQGFTSQALAKLLKYHWPGNIRELQAKVEGGVYKANFHQRRFIEPEDLDLKPRPEMSPATGNSFRERVLQYELQLIREALAKHGQNQSKAAESLQLDRSTLRRILARGE